MDGCAPTLYCGPSLAGGFLFVGSQHLRNTSLCMAIRYDGEIAGVAKPGKLNKSCLRLASDESTLPFAFVENPLVSVVILNKNGYDLLPRCIDAVLQNGYDNLEVLVGDTGSEDERIWDYYESAAANVRVITGLQYHYSKNNNFLAEHVARGELVLFLNNDVFLEKGILGRMLDWNRVHVAGAVGVRLVNVLGGIDHDGQTLLLNGELREPGHVHIGESPSAHGTHAKATDGVTAACMLTRRALFMKLGGFDEKYEDIYQDCDYCLKLRASGFQCVTVRDSASLHLVSATRGVTLADKPAVKRDRELYESKWRGFEFPELPLLSFVTVCNHPEVYFNFHSTIGHPEDVEVIPIWNWDNRFTVTQALNMGMMLATGKHVAYCHQDILLPQGWMREMARLLATCGRDIGVIGFEGLSANGTPYSCHRIKRGGMVEIRTLDELCIISEHRDIPFDEQFRFHYYGSDYCLAHEASGRRNILVGIPTIHLSGGEGNIIGHEDEFRAEAKRLRAKWPHFDFWTTTTRFEHGGIHYMICPDLLNESEAIEL
jgi:GT2 family glycosyltransferase